MPKKLLKLEVETKLKNSVVMFDKKKKKSRAHIYNKIETNRSRIIYSFKNLELKEIFGMFQP